MHLINLKRVAYGVRDVAAAPPKTLAAAASSTSPSSARSTIEQVVDQWLGRKVQRSAADPMPSPSAAAASAPAISAPVAPPLASFEQLEPAKVKVEKKESRPVGFVCEDDVRAAILSNARITIGKKTIITPSARDLAEANDVFVTAD
jgi:hypothetical protein